MASRRLTMVLAVMLAACGKREATPAPADREAAAREAAMKELERKTGEELRRASDLLATKDTEGAWAAWRAARDLAGETPDVARMADEIRRVESVAKEARDWKTLSKTLNEDRQAKSEAERLDRLARAAAEARAFLTAYPSSTHREEVEAGLEYAERELAIQSRHAEALAAAKVKFAAQDFRGAAEAAKAALAILDRPEASQILNDSLKALTPEGMVFVPGGSFLSGRRREKTWLPPFYIDRTEVTNGRYGEFVKATGRAAPDRFLSGAPRAGEEEQPVTWVTLADALEYATWAKKRVPTELEWERAARGTDGRNYPWGDEWDPAKGHFGAGGPLPAGSRPLDVSPDGAIDLAGNVAEFTLPLADREGKALGPVLKGGSWSDEIHPEYALAFERYEVSRDHRDSGTGFRCVVSAPPP